MLAATEAKPISLLAASPGCYQIPGDVDVDSQSSSRYVPVVICSLAAVASSTAWDQCPRRLNSKAMGRGEIDPWAAVSAGTPGEPKQRRKESGAL